MGVFKFSSRVLKSGLHLNTAQMSTTKYNPPVTGKFILVQTDDDDYGNDGDDDDDDCTIKNNIISPENSKIRSFDVRKNLPTITHFDKLSVDTNLDSHYNEDTSGQSINHTVDSKSTSKEATIFGTNIGQKVFVPIQSGRKFWLHKFQGKRTGEINYKLQTTPYICQQDDHQLVKGLRAHNLAFITLCSVFGTGLFITSGTILEMGGPLTLILSYLISGSIVYQVITALADMSTYIQLPDSFSGFAERFVDPALGFSTSYTFLISFLIFVPNQISAGALTISYWVDSDTISPALWILLFLSLIVLVNYCKVTKYVFMVNAFIAAKLMIYLIIAIILMVIICGGGSSNEKIGFKYWRRPGVMTNYQNTDRNWGKLAALIISTTKSVWSYAGIESFSVATVETVNPRKSIPKAKKILFWLLFPTYLTILALIGLVVPFNDRSLFTSTNSNISQSINSSVLFVALYNAGLSTIGNFVNAAFLVFIFSAANTGFYLSTRILYGLSASGLAPSCFSKTTKDGVPIFAFLIIFCFNLIAFSSLNDKTIRTYHYFVEAASVFSLLNWASILITHIRFLQAFKKQNRVDEFKKYVPNSTMCCVSSYFFLFSTILFILMSNLSVYIDFALTKKFEVTDFLAGILPVPIFLSLFFGFKIYYKTTAVSPDKADLYFYRDVIDGQEEAYLQVKLQSLK